MSQNPPATDDWDASLAELCAGYDRPLTPERRAAYRGSLDRIPAVAWKRLVEHCLGPKGPDKFPTTRDLWQISRQLRRAQRAPGATAEKGPAMSRYAMAANLALFKLAYGDLRRGFRAIAEYPPMPEGGYGLPLRLAQPTDRTLLDAVLAMKLEIVGLAEQSERAGDPWTVEEFEDVLRTGFEKLLTPRIAA